MKSICCPALMIVVSGGVFSSALAQTLPTPLEGDRFSQPVPDLRSLPSKRPVVPVAPPVIVIGGRQSVRGYRQNVQIGDNGFSR